MDKLITETGYMTEKMKMTKITERKRSVVKLAKKEKKSIMRMPGAHFETFKTFKTLHAYFLCESASQLPALF